MSKSIYEEALEKIDVEFDSWDRAEYFELVEIVEHALEQAQKQEKLLELYKKIIIIKDELISVAYFDKDYYYFRKIEIDLEKRIKELENENNR